MADTAPGTAPLSDHRTPPRGVLPRGTQTWLMVALALGILGIIVFAGHPEPTPRAASASTPPALAPQPDRLRDYQDRLRVLDDGLHTEQGRVREEFGELEAAWFAGRSPDPARTPRESYYHSMAARYCAVAAWCVTALEAVFAGGLSMLLLALHWTIGAAVGITVTILLAVGLKGVIAPLVLGRYADRPKAGRDLTLRMLVLTGPVALVFLVVLFIVRGMTGVWIAWLFPWATGALAVLCPMIAAALFVLAGLYGWSRRLTDRYRSLERAERDVVELREHCTRALAATSAALPATVGSTRSSGATSLAKVGAALLLMTGLLTSTACGELVQASGQTVTGTAAVTAADSEASVAGIGELWLDDTISVDERDRPRAAGAVLAILFDLSRQHHVDRWNIYGFGEEPWREAAFHQMTLMPWQPPACDPPTEASRIFKVHQDDPVCQERIRAAERAHRQQLEDQVGTMQRALHDHRLRPARCTSIGDLLVRVSQAPEHRLVVIISDGVETCRRTGLPPVPPPQSGARVAFVLIGSTPQLDRASPTVAEQFLARRKVLVHAAPWLRVVAPWEITTTLFPSER